MKFIRAHLNRERNTVAITMEARGIPRHTIELRPAKALELARKLEAVATRARARRKAARGR